MMHVCLSLYDILVPPGHKRTKIHVYGYPLGLHYRPSYIINFHTQNFFAHKTVLGASPCTWEIVPIKEQTCMILMIM